MKTMSLVINNQVYNACSQKILEGKLKCYIILEYTKEPINMI